MELCNITSLQTLDLSGNQLSGGIPPQLVNLINLQTLNLSGSQLSGNIPPELGNMTSLRSLYLGGNLSGNIPPELGNLINLESLGIGCDQLSGSIPPELGNLTNLQSLYLSGNQLSGSIPPELGNLTNLQYLSLGWNQLSGSIPPQLGNLTNLQELWLCETQLSGSIPPELGNLTNLQELWLGVNQLSGSIPPELGSLTNLAWLMLFINQLSGSIPAELGDLVSLETLSLSGNQLSGNIPPQLGNLTSLQHLDLSGNQLSGNIPPQLGNLTDLGNLFLSTNQLSGSIPPELGNLTNSQSLWLGNNQLGGSIPPELGNLASLWMLSLSSNQLSGSIPPELGNLANLQYLYLHSNQLNGSIPPELGNLANLEGLRLDSNQFSGALPGALTNLAKLDQFWFYNTDLCEPADAAFQTWLAGISRLSSTGVICPGLPYTVTLVAYPTSLTVGNTSSLTATVKDQYDDNVADGTVVTFTTSLGILGNTTVTKTTVSGVATATLTSQAVGTAVVTATSDSIYDTVNVTFNPGPPYTATLEANPTSISVGGFTSTLTATVTDQFNNNVADGTVVHFETSLGSLGSVTVTKLTANGVATATLTSGSTAGTAIITATSDSVTATTTVDVTAPTTVSIAISPLTTTTWVSSTFTVDIKFDTGTETADTLDAYIDFDPTYLEVVDESGTPTDRIELNTDVFSSATFNSVDNAAGEINFSASKYDSSLEGGPFTAATIRFRAKAEIDSTPLTFVHSGARWSDLLQSGETINPTITDCTVSITPSVMVLNGRVALERRGNEGDPRWITELYRVSGETTIGGIEVYEAGTTNLLGTFTATTDANGGFSVELTGIEPGTYDISVKGSNTLSNKKSSITLPTETEINFGTLLVGDSNGNDAVNGADVSYMIPSFLLCSDAPEFRPYGDTNNNGCINGADVSALIPNFLKAGPISVAVSAVHASGVTSQDVRLASGESLSLNPSSRSALVGDTFTMDIVADTGTSTADTVDAYIDFDPTYLEVVDESGTPVNAIELNTDVFSSATFNSVDNATGQINFSASEYDSPYLTGSFKVATIRFKAKAAVESTSINFVQSGARWSDLYLFGESINPTLTNGTATVICPDFVDPPGVGVEDIMLVANCWRCKCEDTCYNPLYDLDDDCDIDVVDIMLVVKHWGETCN